MASAVVQKGQQCTWGTSEVTCPVAGGIVVSASVSADGQTDALEDENGARIGLVIYDVTYSGTITVVCKASARAPEVGNSVKAGDFSCYVTGSRLDWQHKGKKQITVTVSGGKNLS